jgi:hypothetical protein
MSTLMLSLITKCIDFLEHTLENSTFGGREANRAEAKYEKSQPEDFRATLDHIRMGVFSRL